jgi:hypothetical protein
MIELGTIKDQFLGFKESKNSNMKFHILEKKRLPTMSQMGLFIIAFSNPWNPSPSYLIEQINLNHPTSLKVA